MPPKRIKADSSSSGIDVGGIIGGLANAIAGELAIRVFDKQISRLDGTRVGKALKWAGIMAESPQDIVQSLAEKSIRLLLEEHPEYLSETLTDYFISPYILGLFEAFVYEGKTPNDLELQNKFVEQTTDDSYFGSNSNFYGGLIYTDFLQIFTAQLSSLQSPGELLIRIEVSRLQQTL